MKSLSRILLFIGLPVVLAVLILLAAYAWWARPNRLSQAQCRDLVTRAWQSIQAEAPSGARILDFNVAGRDRRAIVGAPRLENLAHVADRLREMFPQSTPDDAFFGRVNLTNTGRMRVAGRVCERIRISPSAYAGDSIELWIDPSTGSPFGWRRYDFKGEFVRGYRQTRVGSRIPPLPGGPASQGLFEGADALAGIIESELIPPDRVEEMASLGEAILPTWLPPGFKLVGGRNLPPAGLIEQLRQGPRGRGLGRGASVWGPKGVRLQLIYSDGLNTISITEIRHGPMFDPALDAPRLNRLLSAKAWEVRRIFRTSMAARELRGVLILLFGEVSPDVLNQVAASFPEEGLRPLPPPFAGPGPGFMSPGGPGGPPSPPPGENVPQPPPGDPE